MPPEPDVVYGTVTNNVMNHASATSLFTELEEGGFPSSIDSFELSEEQIQMEIEYQSKVLEQQKEATKGTETKPRREKGWFSSRVGDTRALQSELFAVPPMAPGGACMDPLECTGLLVCMELLGAVDVRCELLEWFSPAAAMMGNQAGRAPARGAAGKKAGGPTSEAAGDRG